VCQSGECAEAAGDDEHNGSARNGEIKSARELRDAERWREEREERRAGEEDGGGVPREERPGGRGERRGEGTEEGTEA